MTNININTDLREELIGDKIEKDFFTSLLFFSVNTLHSLSNIQDMLFPEVVHRGGKNEGSIDHVTKTFRFGKNYDLYE